MARLGNIKGLSFGAIMGAAGLGIGLYLGYTFAKGALQSINQYGGGFIPPQFINSAPYSTDVTYYFPDEDFRLMLA